MLGSGAPQRKGRTWGKEGGEGREEVGALGTVPVAGTFSPGVTEILQTQCMWAEYPLGNSGEEKLPWLSWRVSPQAAKGEKRESDPQEAPSIGFGPAPAPPLPFIPKFPALRMALPKKPHRHLAAAPPDLTGGAGRAPGSLAPPCKLLSPRGKSHAVTPPCRATPRGPGSTPGLRAALRSRGWSQPSVAIWKPHDAAATAHGGFARAVAGPRRPLNSPPSSLPPRTSRFGGAAR